MYLNIARVQTWRVYTYRDRRSDGAVDRPLHCDRDVSSRPDRVRLHCDALERHQVTRASAVGVAEAVRVAQVEASLKNKRYIYMHMYVQYTARKRPKHKNSR